MLTPPGPALLQSVSLPALRVLICSGEPWATSLAHATAKALGQAGGGAGAGPVLLNLYGCTEVAADCACYTLPTASLSLVSVSRLTHLADDRSAVRKTRRSER